VELSIVKWPAKVLETRALEVTSFDAELAQFCQNMHLTMDKEGGLGLAANQVDVLKRVITIFIPFRAEEDEAGKEPRQWWHDRRFTLVNPQIIASSGKISIMEGCLSFPQIYDFVPRARQVTLQAQDETGKSIEFIATDLMAVCLQHEIDHLDGIVFLTRMSRLKAAFHRRKFSVRA
jgi:peptide deformylase